VNTEAPSLIRSRADNRAITLPRDDHGLAAELRIIALLDGSVKRIEVYVDDFAGTHFATILARLPEVCECDVVRADHKPPVR
jgi:hypothetical protein